MPWLVKDLVIGTAAAVAGTYVMGKFSNFVYGRQSEETRKREEEVRREMPTTVLARKLAGGFGRTIEDKTAEQAGTAIHWGFGAVWGPVAATASRQIGMDPIPTGILVGILVWLLVDEGANAMLRLTAPPAAFPLSTHVRAFGNHIVYGAVIGLVIAAGRAGE